MLRREDLPVQRQHLLLIASQGIILCPVFIGRTPTIFIVPPLSALLTLAQQARSEVCGSVPIRPEVIHSLAFPGENCGCNCHSSMDCQNRAASIQCFRVTFLGKSMDSTECLILCFVQVLCCSKGRVDLLYWHHGEGA